MGAVPHVGTGAPLESHCFRQLCGGKSEWSVWDDFEATCLVFVGWKAEREETIRKLKNCIVPDPSQCASKMKRDDYHNRP